MTWDDIINTKVMHPCFGCKYAFWDIKGNYVCTERVPYVYVSCKCSKYVQMNN